MAYITAVEATGDSVTSVTTTAFPTSGDDRLLIIGVGYAHATADQSTRRVDLPTRSAQTAADLIDGGSFPVTSANTDFGDHYGHLFTLANPDTASTACQVTATGNMFGCHLAVVVLDQAQQSGWGSIQTTLDRDTSGDTTSLTNSLTLSSSGIVVGHGWGSHQSSATWGTPAWSAGTSRLGPTTPAAFSRGAVATVEGTGSQTLTWNTNLSGGGGVDGFGVARLSMASITWTAPEPIPVYWLRA